MTAAGTFALDTNTYLTSAVTSVGITVPSAFNVTPSTITSSGTFAITGAGTTSQYVRGDGTLANFPTSTGGGASVSYYLNGSISQGTIGGVAYKEMNSVPVIGAGTDFTINADGYIAQFITDVGDPNKLLIPAGNWNFETYFSASSGGGSPRFYIELYKYDGATFTLIATNSATPENITGGTSIDLYFTALAVPSTSLLITDRLAVRFYVIHSGRTITMHTENSHLSQIITTFSSGLTALNGLTSQVQYFAVGTAGTDFNISSVTDTHTFNLPTASATNRGALSSADWSAFNGKFNLPSLTSGSVLFSNGTTIAQDNANLFWDDTNNRLGIGTTAPTARLHVAAPGALSTDIALRVRNSGDSLNLMFVNGLGQTAIGQGTATLTNMLTVQDVYSTSVGIEFRSDQNPRVGSTFNTSRILSGYSSGTASFLDLQYAGGAYPYTYTTGLRLNSLGNIGIGTTAPTAKLHIAAPGALSTDIALRVRNSADSGDLLTVNGAGTSVLKGSSTNFYVNSNAAGTATGRFIVVDAVASSGQIGLLLSGVGAERAKFFLDDGTGYLVIQNSWSNYGMAFNTAGANTRMFISGVLGNIGIGTTAPVASAKVQIDSTTQGFLPPRMTNAQRIAIATPAVGLCVYCTDAVEGLYINKSTGWTYIG